MGRHWAVGWMGARRCLHGGAEWQTPVPRQDEQDPVKALAPAPWLLLALQLLWLLCRSSSGGLTRLLFCSGSPVSKNTL